MVRSTCWSSAAASSAPVIARDLALRGLKVALVEQHDLASGTSSRPTRLIHGGLRYLEMFDFGLVRTDMREREVLLRMAPHLVQPLPFLMPMYGRGLLYRAKLQAGMQLYDALSFDKSLPTRQWLDTRQVLRAEPGLNPTDLQGAWQYYDAQVSLVERLVIENALDAASVGAVILTNASAVRFTRGESGSVTGAVVRDALSGREVEARARLTVNATGPWLDLTTAGLRPGRRPLLRLTKGVHLVTPSASEHAHVLFARRDGRLFFVIPWLGYSLVGTTDTDYRGDPSEAAATEADVDYLVEEARHAFPSGGSTRCTTPGQAFAPWCASKTSTKAKSPASTRCTIMVGGTACRASCRWSAARSPAIGRLPRKSATW